MDTPQSTDNSTGKQFNDSDADVSIRSSDGILLLLHHRNLAVNTGAFPSNGDFDTQEVVQLTEPADVLRILFQFVYRDGHRDLKKLNIPKLLEVAEAAEKYEVNFAKDACLVELALGKNIERYPHLILSHGLRHEYPELVNQASLQLVRGPADRVLEHIPAQYAIPWVKYQNLWQTKFDDLLHSIQVIPQGNDRCLSSRTVLDPFSFNMRGRGGRGGRGGSHTITHSDITESSVICPNCRFALIAWVSTLEKVKSATMLLKLVKDTGFVTGSSSQMRCEECPLEDGCIFLKSMRETLTRSLQFIPPFSEFLK